MPQSYYQEPKNELLGRTYLKSILMRNNMKASKSVIKALMLLFVCMIGLGTQAQTISGDEAKTIAEQWFGIQSARGKKFAAQTNEISLAYIQPSEQDKEMTNVYVFNRKSGGFVAIAGDARAYNIVLGYSDTDNFKTDGLPENIRYWFGEYARQIDFLRQNEPEVKTLARSKKFASLKRASGVKTEKYLNTALWNQNKPYWNQTPTSNGEQCVTGCVATAMAEVMYYYKYPEKGSGSHSYTWEGQTLSSKFSEHTYKWGNMLQKYSQGYTQEQGEAVALLMSDCGIAVNMDYGSGDDSSGSHSYNAASALTQYFGYSDLITFQVRKNYDDSDWNAMLTAEIDEDRPVIIGAQNAKTSGGHEFVIDGYQIDSDNSLSYYINWGWGGLNNGLFALGAFNPNSTHYYNNDMDAIIHICPNTYDGWGDWEDFGKFGYEYSVLFNSSENVNVKTRKTSDNNYLEFEITDYGSGCIQDYKGFPLKIVVDKTKSVGEGKYLAYISNAIEPGLTSDTGKPITLADKLSTSIVQDNLSYSYYDEAKNELHLCLISTWDSEKEGYVSLNLGIETLCMAWSAWLPFAPSGVNTAKATYNSDYYKNTSTNEVFYRTSTTNSNKQIKVNNWLDNFTNLDEGYDFILNLDGNTNIITFEPLNTGYGFAEGKKIIYHYKDSESRSCYYDPRTGTFYIYGFLGDPESESGFNSVAACDILQMDGTFMTLTDSNGYSATSAEEHVTVSYSREISSDWGTLILPFSIKNNIDGLTFYYLQSASQNGVNSTLTFVKYESDATIPANTPVVFKRSDEQITSLDFLEENTTVAAANTPTINGETVNGWCPVGVYTAQTITDADKLKNDFYFSGGSMHYATKELHIKPFRTYFTNQSSTQIKSITTTFDGEATSIETLFEENTIPGESKRFNLAGQKVSNSYKGVVIMGNKKQLIR